MHCPLCGSESNSFFEDKRRPFYQCDVCELIFVPSAWHMRPEDEKKEYDKHENSPDDEGYVAFLSQLVKPLSSYIKPGMEGLDFGSGPGPTLHTLLEKKGVAMSCYDPLYASDMSLLLRQYDVVTCTEVVEHFNNPRHSWERLVSLVKPGGHLGVMTFLYTGDFEGWWYKNIPTHIMFYSEKTLRYIAEELSLDVLFLEERVSIFRKRF